jgi:phosphoserine phosphatase
MRVRLPHAIVVTLLLGGCASSSTAQRVEGPPPFQPVPGFSAETNSKIQAFLLETQAEKGRKVAVFDGDGTTLGQVPHYLADECLYLHAQAEPTRKPELIQEMTPLSNVSHPYVQDRVFFYEGEPVQALRDRGDACFKAHYANKIYEPMRHFIRQLQAHGFEVWIITASPEAMYQKFLSRELGIPITHVVGVKSVVHGGLVTRRIVEPVPQDEGKKEAIETLVQEQPLVAGGNSRGDREMIESSRGLRMIINPDEHVAAGDTESMADYAKKQGWIIERIRDVREPGFPGVSGSVFKVRENKPHE